MSGPRTPRTTVTPESAWDDLQAALAAYCAAHRGPQPDAAPQTDTADFQRRLNAELIAARTEMRTAPAAFAWWLYSARVARPAAPIVGPRHIWPDTPTADLVAVLGSAAPAFMRLHALELLLERFDDAHREQAAALARMRAVRAGANRSAG